MPDYRVSVCKDFDAETPLDAVQFMIEWLLGMAQYATYEIEGDEGKFLYNADHMLIRATK